MSGELQTIPARHGTATFVPRGHTIKVINTYGKQVVDTWAFALHDAPKDDPHIDPYEAEIMAQMKEDEGKPEEPIEQTLETEEVAEETPAKEEAEGGKVSENLEDEVKVMSDDTQEELKKKKAPSGEFPDQKAAEEAIRSATQKKIEKTGAAIGEASSEANGAVSKSWGSYIPIIRAKVKGTGQPAQELGKATAKASDSSSRTWTSYLYPSSSKEKDAEEEARAAENSRSWSSYIPSGKGFSSYLPDKSTLSAFASTHHRDPNKSYAEQLYDFSKTPVGAAGLSAATGSGTASSLYAAYSAYQRLPHPNDEKPMEYMSMMHSRASMCHITPRVGDTLVSNLRQALLTLIEDTSPGIHDTLIAACDPMRYKELGVKKWEEHGSCAENLVLALEELNEKSGLKGPKAVGADVTINTVPAPLNLFMNIPWTDQGELEFAAPRGKKGDYVKFRAERDLVFVMSACPQDVLEINGKKSMVAHFMVEEPKEEQEEREKREADEKKEGVTPVKEPPKKPAPKKLQRTASQAKKADPVNAKNDGKEEGSKPATQPPPKKKPPKLERRTPSSAPTKKT